MKTSSNGINLIKKYEGFRSSPYLCPAGVWTIGYGTTFLTNGKPVTKDTPKVTQEEAEKLLAIKLHDYERAVDTYVKTALNQNQYDALVSICYNIGQGNFARSNLVKYLNIGNSSQAAAEFLNWNKVSGKPMDGLTRRREEEKKLFLS